MKSISLYVDKDTYLTRLHPFAKMLYIAADDRRPLSVLKGMLPFSHVIEVEGIHDGCTFEIIPAPLSVTSAMTDSETIDVKAQLTLDTIVFEPKVLHTIADVKVSQMDDEKLEKMPAIAGYVVREGDTLWALAKQFYTTKAKIMADNGLESEDLKPKQKLVIVKESRLIV